MTNMDPKLIVLCVLVTEQARGDIASVIHPSPTL